MNVNLRTSVACLLIASTTGCSLFVPWTERVTVTTWSSDASIKIDDTVVGKGQVQADLIRNKSHIITASTGAQTEVTVIDKHLSVTAILDIIGTAFFIVPIVGLFSPGAYDLDRTDVNIMRTSQPSPDVHVIAPGDR